MTLLEILENFNRTHFKLLEIIWERLTSALHIEYLFMLFVQFIVAVVTVVIYFNSIMCIIMIIYEYNTHNGDYTVIHNEDNEEDVEYVHDNNV
jgi:hypothetical protein